MIKFYKNKWLGKPRNLVPFGLMDGSLFYVEHVNYGKNCNCVCPECGESLIAKNNPSPDRKRAFHFQHLKQSNCPGGWETACHRMAKEIILKATALNLPGMGVDGICEQVDNLRINGNTQVEKSALDGRVRPDLILAGSVSGIVFDEIYVEICVHHPVGYEKRILFEQYNKNVLEIDLLDVTEDQLLDAVVFADIVLNRLENRKWINLYNPAYFCRLTRKALVEIVNIDLRIVELTTKKGSLFKIIEQDGFLHNSNGKSYCKFQIPDMTVNVEPKPYSVGVYEISENSLVSQYGQLKMGYKMYLDKFNFKEYEVSRFHEQKRLFS